MRYQWFPLGEGGSLLMAGQTTTHTSKVRSIFNDPTEEERLYFDMIDRAVANNDERVISNGKPAHAVYIMCKFLELAKDRVIINTGKLRRRFNGVLAYEEPGLITRAINFLRRGGHLDILIVDELDIDPEQSITTHPLLKALSETDIGSGKVNVHRLDGDMTGTDAYHFIVVDGRYVRLEVKPEEAEAYVRLHDPETGSLLTRIFGDRVLLGTKLLSIPAH